MSSPIDDAEYARVRGYALTLTRDPTEADDLTQETFLRAHAARDPLRDPGARPAWLYRIATNAYVDQVRRRARRPVTSQVALEDLPLAVPEDSLARVMEQREMTACVRDYLAGLPDTYRAALMLHDLEGLSAPEIAVLLDASVPTIKIRLHRARQKLREALGAGCVLTHDDRSVLVCEPNG